MLMKKWLFFVFSTHPSLLVVGEAGAVYNWRSKRERVLVVRPIARNWLWLVLCYMIIVTCGSIMYQVIPHTYSLMDPIYIVKDYYGILLHSLSLPFFSLSSSCWLYCESHFWAIDFRIIPAHGMNIDTKIMLNLSLLLLLPLSLRVSAVVTLLRQMRTLTRFGFTQ